MLNATVNVLPTSYSETGKFISFLRKFPFRKLSMIFCKNIPISETLTNFCAEYSDFGTFQNHLMPMQEYAYVLTLSYRQSYLCPPRLPGKLGL